MTQVYLMRHAQKSKNITYLNNDENFLLKDEKRILSKDGQKQSELITELPFLQDVDIIFSSHYVRAISTVNYLAEKLNKPILINKNFGERIKKGYENIILPPNFRMLQLIDDNYKCDGGESRREVFERFYNALMEIVIKYNGKKILISSHKNAISMLLMNWCENKLSNHLECFYKNKIILNGHWDGSPEIFKLEFENDKLLNIEKIHY